MLVSPRHYIDNVSHMSVMQGLCFSPFYLACFARPSSIISIRKAWVDILITYQHPLRLRRFGSGASGLLGRGIARQRAPSRVSQRQFKITEARDSQRSLCTVSPPYRFGIFKSVSILIETPYAESTPELSRFLRFDPD